MTLVAAGQPHPDRILREGGTWAECVETAAILDMKNNAEAKVLEDMRRNARTS